MHIVHCLALAPLLALFSAMELPMVLLPTLSLSAALLVALWVWRLVLWVWWQPRKLERQLREQGFSGNSYRFLSGDWNDSVAMTNEARSKPISFTHDISSYVLPFLHRTIKLYGRNCFIWLGPTPRVVVVNPGHVKQVFTQMSDFPKKNSPISRLLVEGLGSYEGEKWAKHRKIINPAFHQEKLKHMLSAFYQSCTQLITKWDKLVPMENPYELDVLPSLVSLTCDMISRAAFGSNYEEGQRIFQLLDEQRDLLVEAARFLHIPALRFLPTKTNRRMKMINKKIKASLRVIIERREQAFKVDGTNVEDLLGILLDSNNQEIQEHGRNKSTGMDIDDMVEECKFFYFAGQESTSVLLIWTMILLGKYPRWQERAREEVALIFGGNMPHFDGMNRLKTVTMILYEVLRLYPPVAELSRTVPKETKLGDAVLPGGTHISVPILLLHHDRENWGEDADEFNPERFGEGISNATKNQVSLIPFGWGPRICIGMNFALLEVKTAMSMILQHFSFELSPSYTHSPRSNITLRPHHGAHLILRKL